MESITRRLHIMYGRINGQIQMDGDIEDSRFRSKLDFVIPLDRAWCQCQCQIVHYTHTHHYTPIIHYTSCIS